MHTGVCYFPEHWPRHQWEAGIERMAAAGIRYVRMGEFAWTRIEPERDRFDVRWLEEAVELIGERGMQVVLCTPTATPPKWLVDEYPEIRQEQPDGTPLEFGSRRHYCYNSSRYRAETERIVTKLATAFADNEMVVGWQTDNEYGCHDTIRCYCKDCSTAFRDWLRDRYGTIDVLNDAWGNVFWSQEYTAFREVDVPGPTPAEHHPSRLLDFYRFSSDSAMAYNRLQTKLLRENNPDWFVTHNFMGDFAALDAFAVSNDLDFASWDSYPTLHAQRAFDTPTPDSQAASEMQRIGDPDVTAMNHDLFRGASDGSFWVMEQQAGDIRAFPYSAEPADGMIRLWTHQSVAHGADVVSYFRWRRCRFGQEQYWGALLNHDGSPDRGLAEADDAARELSELPDLSPPTADVALLFDYDSLWALHAERHAPEFDYWGHLRTYYRALRRRGITVDVVPVAADFETYEAVIAPSLHLIDDAMARRLSEYVHDGGHLVGTIRTSTKDEHQKLHPERAPGPLTDLFGLRVTQHESLSPGLDTRVDLEGQAYEYGVWGEWLDPTSSSVVAHHATGVATGQPAITRHSFGDGTATYVGIWPKSDLADAVIADILDRIDLDFTDPLPGGVRLGERDRHTWVLNFGRDPVTVDGSDHIIVGDSTVGPRDLCILAAPTAAIRIERC